MCSSFVKCHAEQLKFLSSTAAGNRRLQECAPSTQREARHTSYSYRECSEELPAPTDMEGRVNIPTCLLISKIVCLSLKSNMRFVQPELKHKAAFFSQIKHTFFIFFEVAFKRYDLCILYPLTLFSHTCYCFKSRKKIHIFIEKKLMSQKDNIT